MTTPDPEADLQCIMRTCAELLGNIGNLRHIVDETNDIKVVRASAAYQRISSLHNQIYAKCLDRAKEQPELPRQDADGYWRDKDDYIVCKCGNPSPLDCDECDECTFNL